MTAHLSKDLFADLRRIIDLPKNVTEMTIRMGLDKAVEVECKFYPQREVRVTTLESVAHEYALEMSGPLVTKRYRLEQIAEPDEAPPKLEA